MYTVLVKGERPHPAARQLDGSRLHALGNR
jgi:hypothetical protein